MRLILLLAGATYLIWLGAMAIRNATGRSVETNASSGNGLPTTFAGVAAFQFFNPKAWVLVLTAIATIAGQFSDAATLAILVPLYVLIPIVCLSLWALGGVALTLWLDGGKTRKMFDFTMGGLLILCAVFLVINRS